jgi:hypothetical protein
LCHHDKCNFAALLIPVTFSISYDMKLPSSKWILPMFARAPFIARDLNVGHCFETLVVGHVLGTIVFCYRECFDACMIQLEQRTVMRRSLLYAALSHNDSENTMLAL